ncbi:MAG TPA: TolC family protein [Trueperaceae bacterium]|nr:TolC family protein [Trueperaceae bacterium]
MRVPSAGRGRRPALAAALAVLITSAWPAAPALAQSTTVAQPGPLTFADALSMARGGPSVAVSRLAVEQAQAARDAVASPVSATLRGGYAYAWNDAVGGASAGGRLQPFSLDATLNVVPYGPNFDSRQSAQRSLEAARTALQDAVYQATVNAATSYLQALRSQQRVTLDRAALAQAQGALEHVRAQRAAGDATQDALDAAELAALQAQTTVQTDELELQGRLASLSDLVGAPVTAVTGEPPAASDPAVDAHAAERRSDVRSAAASVEAARQSYAAAVRQVLPIASTSADVQAGDGTTTWSAGVGYGTATFQPTVSASIDPTAGASSSSGSALDGTRFAISVAMSVPLDAGIGAALRGARLAMDGADRKLARARQLAALAIASAQRTLAGAHLGVTLAQTQRQHAEAQAARAQQRFDLGLIAERDLQLAQLDARRTTLDAAAANDTLLIDRLELARAIGSDPMEVF